jgi:single-stranded-DNA-specific exonuclease
MSEFPQRELLSPQLQFPAEMHPVLQQVLRQRRLQSSDELKLELGQLLPFHGLKGIEAAVDLLVEAIRQQHRIIIIGDFDADGATSTALACRALRLFGAGQVDYLIPSRFNFGYGLTPEIVEVAAERQPDLIITVDNGIASLRGVKRAHELGIKVLVTDHHLPGAEMPDADALVNPNQHGCLFQSKHLAGVGVIFYVMSALRAALRQQGWFDVSRPEPRLASLLDLVALGTVADLVKLDHNNRILVNHGLQRIKKGQACIGIQALLAVAGRDPQTLGSSDLGFVLGPRINAAGRMEEMSIGVECLLSDDPAAARALAAQLDQLNRQRRQVEGQMVAEAETIVDSLGDTDSLAGPGLCLYQPQWHQGVVGIVASRMVRKLKMPVVVFARGDEGQLKGSARSVKGIHIRDVLEQIDTMAPGLMLRYGGHAMAAGLTLEEASLDQFQHLFQQQVRQMWSQVEHDELLSDGPIPAQQLDLELARTLNHFPWGQGMEAPLFDGRFQVADARDLKGGHLKLTLLLPESGELMDGIVFNSPLTAHDVENQSRVLLYRPELNSFQGQQRLQLNIQAIAPC